MRNPFTPPFEQLPTILSIFPLAGAVVLPEVQLPLNIYEPRYLNMVFDCLGSHRMIGMVQPDPSRADEGDPGLFEIGTAGRITSFSETEDGRLLIVLEGICRFRLGAELPSLRGYRRFEMDWSDFSSDYEDVPEVPIDRIELLELTQRYFRAKAIEAKTKILDYMGLSALINFLACHMPWEVREKQAMLECPRLPQRGEMLLAFLELAIHEGQGRSTRNH